MARRPHASAAQIAAEAIAALSEERSVFSREHVERQVAMRIGDGGCRSAASQARAIEALAGEAIARHCIDLATLGEDGPRRAAALAREPAQNLIARAREDNMFSKLFWAVVFVCLMLQAALAQDPTKVEPKHYRLAFENEMVQVVDVHYGPHEKSVMHDHPGGVVVVITAGHLRFTDQNGKSPGGLRRAGRVPLVSSLQTQGGESRRHFL